MSFPRPLVPGDTLKKDYSSNLLVALKRPLFDACERREYERTEAWETLFRGAVLRTAGLEMRAERGKRRSAILLLEAMMYIVMVVFDGG